MRKFLIFIFLVICGIPLFAQQLTEIRGKVLSGRFKKICLYKTVNGRQDTLATSIPSADGTFGFLFKSTDSSFYSLGNPRISFRIYLKPSDKASVNITDSLLTFIGANTKENIALGQWEKISQKLRKMTIYFKGGNFTYKEMFPELDAVNAKGKALAKTINTGNKSFDNLFSKTAAYDVDYYALMSIHTPRTAHPKKEDYPATLTNILSSKLYDNDDVLKLPNGAQLLNLVCSHKLWIKSDTLSNFDDKLACVGGILLKGELVIGEATRYKLYKEFSDFEVKYGKLITTPDQKSRMENMRTKLLVYKEGTPAYDFTYSDTTGKKVSLSDFKGKVVLVDVWATWCGPCKQELPFMQTLEEEYNGKDIVFMSVTVDEKKDYEKWKSFIKEKKLGGVQLFAEGWTKIAKDYKIKGIPRFMLFDKKGNIVTIDAPRPSNAELKVLINKQLSK